MAAIGLSLPGFAQKADKPELYGPGAKGAFGSVTSFREGPNANVLYLEEKGTVRLPVPLPVEGSRREALPALEAARAPEPEAARKTAPPATARTGARQR